jgi:molybdenum cofactor cytidylyltransferase
MSTRPRAAAGPEAGLCGLLLAAGASRRLGQPKQLLERGGEPLIRRTARLLRQQVDRMVVVLGAHAGPVRAALQGVDADLVCNPDWAAGMGSSIACGAASLETAAAVMIVLCDQYRIDENSLKSLRHAWQRRPQTITAARWPGGFGPPVIFPADRLRDLRSLRGDQGARKLVAADPSSQFVDLPEAAFDVDRPADLAALEDSPSR